ncbi:MAG: protein kinase [Chloroflexota bacterium]
MAWVEGEKVGGYTLGKQLGSGGMATVYLGHHPELDRQVAIKVMHQNFLEDEGFVARFRREAQIVARLTHPHIVPVYDFSEHDGQPYLVMKYVPGFTLKKQLIKNPPDLEGILDIVTAIGDALNYAHEQGILHRDIKPSNIVIARDGVPYLTDFGLARLVSSGESTMSADMLLGTPHYISPEQARGIANLDGRTDIYSMGVVLYELLVGKVPFTGESAFSIIHDHIYTPLPAPTEVNPEIHDNVEAVLYKALAKSPDERYETANEMISALTDAIKQDDLKELSPDRASIAEASLAKIRADYDDQPTITPVMGVGSPIPKGSSVRQAKVYSRPEPFYNQERFWFLSGCGSLLIVTFLSFAVLLGMSSNLQELSTLAQGNFIEDARFGFLDATLDTLVTGSEYQVNVNREAGFPILEVPYVPSDTLPETVDNVIIALLTVRSLYEEGEQTGARSFVVNNLPENPQIQASFLLSSARIAEEYDDSDAVVVYAIVASELTQDQPFIADEIQNVATEIIYQNADISRATAITDTFNEIAALREIPDTVLLTVDSSEFVAFATIRGLLVNERVRLAMPLLERVPNDGQLAIEFDLLQAEYLWITGDEVDAELLLNDILDNNDTPEWVNNRAEDILTVLTRGD